MTLANDVQTLEEHLARRLMAAEVVEEPVELGAEAAGQDLLKYEIPQWFEDVLGISLGGMELMAKVVMTRCEWVAFNTWNFRFDIDLGGQRVVKLGDGVFTEYVVGQGVRIENDGHGAMWVAERNGGWDGRQRFDNFLDAVAFALGVK